MRKKRSGRDYLKWEKENLEAVADCAKGRNRGDSNRAFQDKSNVETGPKPGRNKTANLKISGIAVLSAVDIISSESVPDDQAPMTTFLMVLAGIFLFANGFNR